MNEYPHTVIIITGPTASGKTALSLQLAEELGTSIISADSRQCYRELNIGVAKPTREELQRVKHYFINSHSIFDDVTADTFERYALAAVEEIFKNHQYAVMVGGTGLYIKAFCEGLDPIPPVDEKIREEINRSYHQYGLQWLQNEVSAKDPLFWKTAEQQNPRRLIRALEVMRSTGKPVSGYRTGNKKKRPFNILTIGLDISKPLLHQNIHQRAEHMIASGLVEEAASLLPYKHFNALQTVGYREMFDYLEGITTLQQAVDRLKRNTRQYAKRQLTWFKKDESIYWMHAADYSSVMSLMNQVLSMK